MVRESTRVNKAHRARKPWRNSTNGRGSVSTRKQRDYVRKLEEWTDSDPITDTHLNTMTRGDIGDYIDTLKYRLEKKRR